MPIIQKAYNGTFLGHSHPEADSQGYAVDDPPEPAVWKCKHCEVEGDPKDFVDEDTCCVCDAEMEDAVRSSA